MDWKPLEDGVPYDWNDGNDRFEEIKTEVNALPGSAVQRHSLHAEHLPSIVTDVADHNTNSPRYTRAAPRPVRGFVQVNCLKAVVSTTSIPSESDSDGRWSVVEHCQFGTPVDLYEDGQLGSGGAGYSDIDSDDFITHKTGILVMANVGLRSLSDAVPKGFTQRDHVSTILEAIVTNVDGTSPSTRITIPGSFRYWRTQVVSGFKSKQRVDLPTRYMLSYNDVNFLTTPPGGSLALADIRYVKGIRLLIGGTAETPNINFVNSRISAMRFHHDHCVRSG